MKKLIAISLAVLMVLAAVGCNTTTMGPTTEPTTEPATEAPMTDEPTALPTEPDLEQDIIEAAWAFAELIEQVHEQQFIKEGAEVKLSVSGNFADVCFASALYPYEMLYITLILNENGNYEVSPASCYIDRAEGVSIDVTDARFGDDAIGNKSDELHNAQIVVTVDDVRAAGCEEEIGSNEYRAAVAEVYGEKLAEYYRGSFTEDSLFYCFDVRCIDTEAGSTVYPEDSYYNIVIAFRVRDIRPFSYLFS
ncbi:MAG: hypothetical protein MR530_01090, partial [Clostridiales bacterium]|nr:hypothetical protein [Clostridiales bacterium]